MHPKIKPGELYVAAFSNILIDDKAVEAIVERIDYMVGVGETVMSPLSIADQAVRNAFNALRNRGSR